MNLPRSPAFVAALLAAALCVGCVTERVLHNPKGVLVKPNPEAVAAARARNPQALPPGPVAKAADPATTRSASAAVAITPIASVEFDGRTLPLLSPDGAYFAVQVGEAPTWPNVLALTGQQPQPRSGVSIYKTARVEGAGEGGGRSVGEVAERQGLITPTADLSGLILGRSATAEGFLVEAPQADGSRWIGRVAWSTGELTWLVQGTQINAFAIEPEPGRVVFSRRDQAESNFTLMEHSGETDRILAISPLGSFVFPVCSPDRSALGVVCLSGESMSLDLLDPNSGAPRHRKDLAPNGGLAAAQRVFSSVEAVPPADSLSPLASTLLYLHPTLGRVCMVDAKHLRFVALSPGSAAATRVLRGAHACIALTTPAGLELRTWQGEVAVGGELFGPSVGLTNQAWVPRQVSGPRMCVFGMDAGPTHVLTASWLEVVGDKVSAPIGVGSEVSPENRQDGQLGR